MTNDLTVVNLPEEVTMLPDSVSLEFVELKYNNDSMREKRNYRFSTHRSEESSSFINFTLLSEQRSKMLDRFRLIGIHERTQNTRSTIVQKISRININISNTTLKCSADVAEMKKIKSNIKNKRTEISLEISDCGRQEITSAIDEQIECVESEAKEKTIALYDDLMKLRRHMRNHERIIQKEYNIFCNKLFDSLCAKYQSEVDMNNTMKMRIITNRIERFHKLVKDKGLPADVRTEFGMKISSLKKEKKKLEPYGLRAQVNLLEVYEVMLINNIKCNRYINILDHGEYHLITINTKITSLIENFLEVNEIEKKHRKLLMYFVDVVKWVFSTIDENDLRDIDEKMDEYVKYLIKLCNNMHSYRG